MAEQRERKWAEQIWMAADGHVLREREDGLLLDPECGEFYRWHSQNDAQQVFADEEEDAHADW